MGDREGFIQKRWSSPAVSILAAIGAVWGFSALPGENGGGASLVPYLIAVFVFTLPHMILESAAGRHFRGTVVGSLSGDLHTEFQ